MSELHVAKIKSYPTGNTVTVEEDVTVAGGYNLTCTDSIILAGGAATAGDIAFSASADITGCDNVGTTSVSASGAITGGSVGSSGALTATGDTTLDGSLSVGADAGGTPAAQCALIARQFTVENENAAGTSVTVSSGNVDAASSEVLVDSLTVGGVNYDATKFANFNAASVLKVFGRVEYNMSSDTIIGTAGMNVTSAATSSSNIQVNWAASIPTDATIIWASSEDGDEPDDSGAPGDQKCFQLTARSATSATFTLMKDNNLDSNETLHFIVLDTS